MGTREEIAFDRALGALIGGALGDAMGMPTQLLSPAEIKANYGFVDCFIDPAPEHPVSKGLKAGSVTDDTEQTLLMASVLLQSGDSFDHHAWVNALVAWEKDIKARGGYDLLGPSTKRAIDAINAGTPPEEAGRSGETNGAAMRIAPVGILVPPGEALIARVAESCRATHNTTLAISSAAAVASVISHGIDGADWREAIGFAVAAARAGERQGHWVPGGTIAARIEWALDMVEGCSIEEGIARVFDRLGTAVISQESVPAAFAVLKLAKGDAWEAAVIAANLGGDTDTIGAIAGSMAGACAGYDRLPQDRIGGLVGIDLDDVRELARALVRARLTDEKARHG
ncbi:ADP-ribosylglycohydrolase family protein [Mesorhizobium sp. RMAD-H1]|uniref:ADP-ribosylglycohydrolase family protein n=1 Tax=Mesorhizobium sp. RMAD-H1 TaxID=2587065 RepID=UPI0016176B88|nr:ADP-ribosylglycohydrolase family protein [Mesorhizobium sp. RMAD-H1]MBB2973166.1 ADP-ribosylglycohydrolase [Mesorhizobium sp. RMAD-H1]